MLSKPTVVDPQNVGGPQNVDFYKMEFIAQLTKHK